MTKLFIVRHGECQANVDGIVAGALNDSPLTKVGERQAVDIAKKLKNKNIQRIVSSNLTRAAETAKIIKKTLDLHMEIEIDERFTERNVGDATGIRIEDYYQLEKSGDLINGSESEQIMYLRIKEGLKTLRNDGMDTLLVTHNGTYRMIKCILTGKSYREFAFTNGLKNGQIKEVVFN